ncbi:MAG: GGDEF domain-containing protein [Leptonema sp. (in: bacteria)]
MHDKIDYLKKEIERLNQIINAYEKFRELSHKELKEANQLIQIYQEVQELSRVEQLSLYEKLNLIEKNNTLEEKLNHLLDLHPYQEDTVIELLKKEEPNNHKVFSTFLYILTHYEFSEEEAQEIYKKIREKQKEMEFILKRPVNFRVVMLDYFLTQKQIFKNPITIEIKFLKQLQHQASFDELTNVFNRRFILYILEKELDRAKRHKHDLALVIFDIDNFKQINDVMGHLVGDKVLKLFAKVVKDNIRNEDSFGRLGGEEFLLILPETPVYNAQKLLDRIRDILAEVSGEKHFFTFSSGIAGYPYHAEDVTYLLHCADQSLLKSKAEGKNRDTIYQII